MWSVEPLTSTKRIPKRLLSLKPNRVPLPASKILSHSSVRFLPSPDVLSVISTLTRLIADELAKGNIVEIGELGRLRFNMRSKAAKSVKEFTHSNILTPTLHFLPGMLLKDARRRIRFTLADEKGKTAEGKGKPVTPPNSGSGGGTSSSGEGNE